ncbi:MAG: hypothetical protein FWC39_00005 [Bacteroidetes bacterium]|nr:hypothetical protein [Bacteroidota bacterium]
MKTNILKIATLLLIFATLLSGCKKEEFIEFTEFQLFEFGCNWKNTKQDEVIIINSTTELEKYTDCTYGEYPEIDFSKHTLLLASGCTSSGIHCISAKELQQLSAKKYKLNVEITLNDAAAVEKWTIALITNKLSNTSKIKLNTTIIRP